MFQVEKLVSDPIVMFLDNKICVNYWYLHHMLSKFARLEYEIQ